MVHNRSIFPWLSEAEEEPWSCISDEASDQNSPINPLYDRQAIKTIQSGPGWNVSRVHVPEYGEEKSTNEEWELGGQEQ